MILPAPKAPNLTDREDNYLERGVKDDDYIKLEQASLNREGGSDHHLSVYKEVLTYIYSGLFITPADSHVILSLMTTLVTYQGLNINAFSQHSV